MYVKSIRSTAEGFKAIAFKYNSIHTAHGDLTRSPCAVDYGYLSKQVKPCAVIVRISKRNDHARVGRFQGNRDLMSRVLRILREIRLYLVFEMRSIALENSTTLDISLRD